MNTLTGSVIDDDMYDELEEKLLLADVGGDVAVHLVDKLPPSWKRHGTPADRRSTPCRLRWPTAAQRQRTPQSCRQSSPQRSTGAPPR